MPRVPVVSRELTVTKAECTVVDMSATGSNLTHKTLYAGRPYKTAEPLIDSLRKTYETDTFKVVRVNRFAAKKVKAQRTVEDFIAGAEILEESDIKEEEETE